MLSPLACKTSALVKARDACGDHPTKFNNSWYLKKNGPGFKKPQSFMEEQLWHCIANVKIQKKRLSRYFFLN